MLILALCIGLAFQDHGDHQLETAGINVIPVDPPGDLLDKIKTIDSQAGALIEQAYLDGYIGFVTFTDEGNFGVHDYNTIGYTAVRNQWIQALAILHEWDHICNAPHDPTSPPLEPPAPPHDIRILDPCFACTHLEMVVEDLADLDQLFCGDALQGGDSWDCWVAYREIFEIACDLYERCQQTAVYDPAQCEQIAASATNPDHIERECILCTINCE